MTPTPPALQQPASPPKPVAFCITELDPGGAERALAETVKRLDPAAWTPHVFSLGPETDLSRSLQSAGVSVTSFAATSRHAVGAIRRLRAELKTCDAVAIWTSLFHANIVGRLAARPLQIPIIAGHRVAERRSRWHLWLERATGHLVSHHVAVSEAVRRFLIDARIASESNSSVVYNGVDVSRFANAKPAEFGGSGPVVLFAGRLDRQKGVETLFEAWPTVVTRHPGARLVIAGRGPMQNAVAAFTDRESSSEWIGFQSDIAPWLALADVVVLPSLWEGLPNVVLESLAAGTPCVVSDVEGVSEVFGDDRSTIITPGDATSLTQRLSDVLADIDLFSGRAESLQSAVLKRFTWDKTAAATAATLEAVLSASDA